MKKSLSTELTQANITQVLALLTSTPEKLEKVSQPLTVPQMSQPIRPGERSPTEILAHLLHCEARAAEAIYSALLLKEPLLLGIHPERQFGRLVRYDLLPFADLLAYFKFRRTVLLHVLASLTESQWARTIREEGKKRRESVYWQARGQALHEVEHLAELENLSESS
jgi:hypothetical protein